MRFSDKMLNHPQTVLRGKIMRRKGSESNSGGKVITGKSSVEASLFFINDKSSTYSSLIEIIILSR